MKSKYILESRYAAAEDFRFEAEFDYTSDAHAALVDHIEQWNHIEVRIRKVKYVTEERVIGQYVPITSEEY